MIVSTTLLTNLTIRGISGILIAIMTFCILAPVNPTKAKQLTNIRAAGSDENLILTPHIAGLTLECRKRMEIETCENIMYYLSNRSNLNVANIINGKKIGLEI